MWSIALALAAYSLVDPVPADKMRPLATDRPDLTEGPFTVDAGHLQLEMDAVVVSLEGDFAGVDFAGLNARVGVFDDVDVHVIVPTVGASFDRAGYSGANIGDLTLRLKWNLVGNADGDIAAAVLPYLVVPDDLRTTGGLIVPVNFNLPWELGLGCMVQVEAQRLVIANSVGQARGEAITPLVVASASLARGIVGGVGAYLEVLVAATSPTVGEAWASAGTTWQATDDLQLDLGGRVRNDAGAGARFEGFAGISVRR